MSISYVWVLCISPTEISGPNMVESKGNFFWGSNQSQTELGGAQSRQISFLLEVLGLEPRDSAWATPLALFALVILETGSHFLPRLTLTTILLAITGRQVHIITLSFFSIDIESHKTFFAQVGLTWNLDPPISFPSSLGWQMCTTIPSYWLRWGLTNSTSLPSNSILLISAPK
jgi:hypothetical protein